MTKKTLMIAVLALLAVQQWQRRPPAVGFDFYQFWAVSKARSFTEEKLASPYVERERYAAALSAHAQQSPDERLRTSSGYRGGTLDLTGTPLFYWVFGGMPRDYTVSLVLYQLVLLMMFLVCAVVMGAVYHKGAFDLLPLACLLLLAHDPLVSDLYVGNVNAVQLGVLALFGVWSDRCAARRDARPSLRRCAMMVGALVLVTLLKPNLALVCLLLACHLWVIHGTRLFLRALAVGVVFGVVLMALPCLRFGSWRVWLDWYTFLAGAGGGGLVYPVADGNFATVVLLADALGIGVVKAGLLVAFVLLASLYGALRGSMRGGDGSSRTLAEAGSRLLRDPQLCLAVGIVVTLAISPLVWKHYYVLSLLPAFWLLSPRRRGLWPGALSAASIVLTSGVVVATLAGQWVGVRALWPYGFALGLLPLWLAVLIVVARISGPHLDVDGPGV